MTPFEIGTKDIIDILLVALMLYYVYRLMRESRSLNVSIGILIFIFIWLFVSQILEVYLLDFIMNKLVSAGIVGLITLFQEEICHFSYELGVYQRFQALSRLFINGDKQGEEDKEIIILVVLPCTSMAKGHVGALIVIERGMPLNDIVETGDVIDAKANQQLIENTFFKDSPLYGGAMIISKKRIKVADCILSVSYDLSVPKELGLRHRAAAEVTRNTDAIAVAVSEETGRISAAMKGRFRLGLSTEELESLLAKEMEA